MHKPSGGYQWRANRANKGIAEAKKRNDALRAEAELVKARACVLAWKTAFDGIEAHILDRMAMGDSADPATYLAIIRADVARVLNDARLIEASFWHDRQQAIRQLVQAKEI
jgi:hypothetical protein